MDFDSSLAAVRASLTADMGGSLADQLARAMQLRKDFHQTPLLLSYSGDVANDAMRALLKQLGMSTVSATQLGLEVGAIQAQALGIATKLNEKSTTQQNLLFSATVATIEALEDAMQVVITAATDLYKTDITTDPGLEHMSNRITECAEGFRSAKNVVQHHLELMSDLHAQVVELQSSHLAPLQQLVETTANLFGSDLSRSTDRYRLAKSQAGVQEAAAVAALASQKALEAKERDNRASARTGTIVAAIFSFGITLAANVDVLGFRAKAADAHNQAVAAQALYKTANDKVTVLNYQMRQVREQSMYLKALQGDIPRLVARTNFLRDNFTDIESRFGNYKAWTSALAVRAENLRQTARNTSDLSVVQKEFSDGLLTICQQVLVDPRLLDEVKTVTDMVDQHSRSASGPTDTRSKIEDIRVGLGGRKSIVNARDVADLGPLGIPITARAKLQMGCIAISSTDRLPIGPLGIPSVKRIVAKAH